MTKPTSTPDFTNQIVPVAESTPLANGKTVVEKTKQNLATVQGHMPGLPDGPSNVPPGGRDGMSGYTGLGSDRQVSTEGGRKYSGSMSKSKVIKGNQSQADL